MAMPIDGGIVLFSLLFLACRPVAAASGASRVIVGGGDISPKSILGGENLAPWANGLLKFSPVASAPAPDGKAPLVLARKRTSRPDMLNNLRMYRDGWDVTNKHYWASVGFTGAPGFVLAFIWFILFALALVARSCCSWRIELDKEKLIFLRQISLVLLLVFTCAALIGCVLLSVGQDEFHGEVMDTLNFVVNQSDFTVDIIRNVTDFLSLAKSISVDQLYLPYDVRNKIGKLNVDLNDAANTLSGETAESSTKVRQVFDNIRFTLILVAAIMLLLAIIGFLLSVLGHKHAVYIFIVTGWLLVAVTFILCGFFIIVSNAVGDACVAMGEWVHNSHAETSLSSILPCVDEQTTNLTLYQGKEVIVQLVNVVNTAIYSQARPVLHNQSGPAMPSLCSPYDSNLHDRQCKPEEVSLVNASTVWQNYTCAVSESGLCVTAGRVTPDIYKQLVAAVNLELDLRVVNAGLGLISTGVMLCLIFWFLYANRPRRREGVFAKRIEIKTAIVDQTPS